MLGNARGAPGLECTANGPTLRFNTDTVICLAGAEMHADLDGVEVTWWKPIAVTAGSTLRLGALAGPGLRAYVLVQGGLAVPPYLGSAATFTLGGFGGHGGRELRAGDVLHVDTAAVRPDADHRSMTRPRSPRRGTSRCSTVRTARPISSPATASTRSTPQTWHVHYNSSRTGVRLIGPKPQWARPDGGEAGLHPSNLHDTAYTVGAVDFTGDMPIILGPDGPSLGGFVCPITVATDERWKVGQLAPGDAVRFVRREHRPRRATADGRGKRSATVDASDERAAVLAVRPAQDDAPAVTYRRAGDRALLVEYGPMTLDLDLRLRAHALADWVDRRTGAGSGRGHSRHPFAASAGRRHHADAWRRCSNACARPKTSFPRSTISSCRAALVHLPLSWDDPATREAIDRYMRDGARRRAVVPVEHRVHPARQRSRRRR